MKELILALIVLLTFTTAIVYAEPERIDIDFQSLCIYVKYYDSLDCDWKLMVWTDGQYIPMVGYYIISDNLTPREQNSVYHKYTTSWQLAGFYIPDRAEIHIYLPLQHTPDIWGFPNTLSHEITHAELYADWMARIMDGEEVLPCTCNFHDGQGT